MTATPLVGTTFFGLDLSQVGRSLLSLRRRVSKRVLLIEFASDALHLAEATISQSGVRLTHLSRIVLPAEALERGVPAEPATMASLIQDFCTEKGIPAHRAAVVIPPEVAFQRSLALPAGLSLDEARSYVLDAANGVQLPFPLVQTDFDLFPLSAPSTAQTTSDLQPYMISAVPQALVDRVVNMFELADMELHLLELGSHSLLRGMALDLLMLAPQQVMLVLELLPECSNLMFATCSGLLGSDRLTPIRDFPRPELDEEGMRQAVELGQSAESLSIKGEGYLPISALDLRVLIGDLKQALKRYQKMFPTSEIHSMRLTGINSAHPLLADLLSEALAIPVEVYRPLLAHRIAGFSADDLLIQSNLGRLSGLALGLLSSEQLVSCCVDQADASTRPSNSGSLVDVPDMQLISSAVASSLSDGVDAPLEAELEPPVSEIAKEHSESSPSGVDVAEVIDVSDDLDQADTWPSIAVVEETSLPVKDGVKDDQPVSVELIEEEDAWPSIHQSPVERPVLPPSEDVVEPEQEPITELQSSTPDVADVSDDEQMDESAWPSIATVEELDLTAQPAMDDSSLEAADEVWPSIHQHNAPNDVSIAPESVGSEELSMTETWPSIADPVAEKDSNPDDADFMLDDEEVALLLQDDPDGPIDSEITQLQVVKESQDAVPEMGSAIDQPDYEAFDSSTTDDSGLGELRFADP